MGCSLNSFSSREAIYHTRAFSSTPARGLSRQTAA
jgi:hypothetical protein